MGNIEVHFSSKSNEWGTPPKLFQWLDNKFGFDLDAAATKENAKCRKFYTIEDDALKQDWIKGSDYGNVFLNPPYGNDLGKFIKKAYEESQKDCSVVCLIPARTDTKYFHDYCTKGCIYFIKGRLKFINGSCSASAPFPSAIVVFYKKVLGISPATGYIEQLWEK